MIAGVGAERGYRRDAYDTMGWASCRNSGAGESENLAKIFLEKFYSATPDS
jgi:hypothetical protein